MYGTLSAPFVSSNDEFACLSKLLSLKRLRTRFKNNVVFKGSCRTWVIFNFIKKYIFRALS